MARKNIERMAVMLGRWRRKGPTARPAAAPLRSTRPRRVRANRGACQSAPLAPTTTHPQLNPLVKPHRSTQMVPYFPPELISHVFTFLPTEYPYQERTPTLWACSLVCRAWRPLAQEALLSHVDFLRKKRYLIGSKGVDGLLAMASKVPGGWRCELLRTSGITDWAQKRRLFEGVAIEPRRVAGFEIDVFHN
jgi:hypothetical protein